MFVFIADFILAIVQIGLTILFLGFVVGAGAFIWKILQFTPNPNNPDVSRKPYVVGASIMSAGAVLTGMGIRAISKRRQRQKSLKERR